MSRPAEVCYVCGEVLVAPETVRDIETSLKADSSLLPSRMVHAVHILRRCHLGRSEGAHELNGGATRLEVGMSILVQTAPIRFGDSASGASVGIRRGVVYSSRQIP